MTNKQLLKMAGWFFYFLACLIPVYMDWVLKNGPDWLSQESAVTSGILICILLWVTGSKLTRDKDNRDQWYQ